MIGPGATIGILGGGQLGRMTALAAARLGYRCHVFAPEPEAPASDVACWTRAPYADLAALDRFAETVDLVTLEFENLPVASLEHLARKVPVRPGARVLAVTQDRLAEKAFLAGHGIALAPWHPVRSPAEAEAALAAVGGRGILKTTRLGYDGKGQRTVDTADGARAAFATLGGGDLVMEGFVDFLLELSVVTARDPAGRLRSYPPVENRHENHILRTTLAPAAIPAQTAQTAIAMAETIAQALQVEGLVAVEMFLARDGAVLVNELAPRPHNSGHWTMDGCAVSQFEQLVRAVCGLPLGDTTPLAPTRMDNLLGDEIEAWPAILAEPGARLHLYGKREAKHGRKMGHVNRFLSEVRR